MGQAALRFVNKQNAYIIRSVCLKSLGSGVGKISHFLCFFPDHLFGLFADIPLIVQGLADGCD